MRPLIASFAVLSATSCANSDFSGGEEGKSACDTAASGAVWCDGENFRRCRDGKWLQGECEDGCVNGECGRNACPDDPLFTCTSSGDVRACYPDVGGWETSSCEQPGHSCVNSMCQETLCAPDLLSCQGQDTVVQCTSDGMGTQVVQTCPENSFCSSGVCRDACDFAADQASFVGCRYYALDTDNNAHDGFAANDPLQYDVVLANPSDTNASNVTISERVGDTWQTVTTATVAARGVAIVPLTCTGGGGAFGGGACSPQNVREDRHPEDTVQQAGLAFRVDADLPIVAYQFNSDDLDGSASSSGATILMPEAALGTSYYALTLPQSADERAWVAVVGMADDTTVTVRVAGPTVAGVDISALPPGGTIERTIDEGEVLQLSSASAGDDLSGTFVSASQAVAVFAGNECARMGGGACQGDDFGTGGDHTEEAMMPVDRWGKEFVAAHVSHPDQDDAAVATWKIVAWTDDTTVTFTNPGGVGGVPSSLALSAGEVSEFVASGLPGHFFVEASQAIQMVQFIHGETAAILVVPTEQYLPDYVFLAPPFFEDTLVVARPAGANVLLDGASPLITWDSAGSGFEVGLDDFLTDGTHTLGVGAGLKGSNPGIQLVGMDANCSYGYLGGLNAERINPID